jgi:hypothetical protein
VVVELPGASFPFPLFLPLLAAIFFYPALKRGDAVDQDEKNKAERW